MYHHEWTPRSNEWRHPTGSHPGQWQPVPKQLDRKLSDNSITATLCYPDSSRHLTGFNPMIYPDLHLIYTVQVESKGKHIEVTVDLDRPIPQEFIGKVGFNLEFFPGSLFGKPWIMDGQSGIFRNSPTPHDDNPTQLSAYGKLS